MKTLRTGWRIFRRRAELCSRVSAIVDQLAAAATCVAGRK
jgi:hypothetical protein